MPLRRGSHEGWVLLVTYQLFIEALEVAEVEMDDSSGRKVIPALWRLYKNEERLADVRAGVDKRSSHG